MGNTTSEHLITAITENKVEDVKKLLSPPHKISANSKDFFECSALLHACGAVDRRLRLGCVEALIQHGADPHALHPSTGLSAIHYASRIADPRLLRVLLLTRPSPIPTAGSEVRLAPPPVDVNIRSRDAHRNTPLHLAAARPVPSIPVIRLLLRHGADPLLPNKHNALPALSEDLLCRIREMPADPADELCALNPLDTEAAFIPDEGLDDPDLHDFFPAIPHGESAANSQAVAALNTTSILSPSPSASAVGKAQQVVEEQLNTNYSALEISDDVDHVETEVPVGSPSFLLRKDISREQHNSKDDSGPDDSLHFDEKPKDSGRSLLDEVNRQFGLSQETSSLPVSTNQSLSEQQEHQLKQSHENIPPKKEINQGVYEEFSQQESIHDATQENDSDLEDYIKDAFLITAPGKPKPAYLSDTSGMQHPSSIVKHLPLAANAHFSAPQPIPSASNSAKFMNDRDHHQSEAFAVIIGGGEANHHPSKSMEGNSLMQRSRPNAASQITMADEVDQFQKEIEEFQREMDELRSKGYSVGQVVAVKPLDIEESEPVTLTMPLVDGAEESDVPRIIASALPISKESSERIHKNLSMFQANYALVVIVLLFLCAVLNPGLALAVLFLSILWYWVMNQQRRTVPLGRSSGQQTIKNVAVVVATAIALLFFAADPMIFWLVTGVFSVVAIHAFIYVPLDR